jgi:hypothetical protein
MRLCPETSVLVKVGQKYRVLHAKIYVRFVVSDNVNPPEKYSRATFSNFILPTVSCSPTIHTEHIVACLLRQSLCEHATMLCYTSAILLIVPSIDNTSLQQLKA